MKRLIWKLAERFGITKECMETGYEWGWRAARAHPEAVTSTVTSSRPDPRGQAM